MAKEKRAMYVANLYAHVSVRKRFRVEAVGVADMIQQVLRLAQNLTPADFQPRRKMKIADEVLDHGYDGDISIDNTSLRSGQRRVVFSFGSNTLPNPLVGTVNIELSGMLLEELVSMIHENTSNVLTLLGDGQ